MKGLLLVFWACVITCTVVAQPVMREITYDSVYQYEKIDGRLRLHAYLNAEEYKGETLRFFFDERPLGTGKVSPEGTVEVWLPLIGEKKILTAYTDHDKRPAVEQLYEPLIPSDWGYFKNGTIHIIASSHQDIAWVDGVDTCRYNRIHHIVEPAMRMLEQDPEYAFGMEQTLNLMEYLDEFPEKKARVIENYKKGKFVWGATFNQPYEGLESGEQLIRQAYYGRKWIKENLPGCDDVTAYNVDIPGRSAQAPQIFAKSGIKNLFISRMREGLYNWYSPDGSKVLTYSPANYGWAIIYWRFFDGDAVSAFHKLHHRAVLWSNYYEKHNIPPHYAIVISYDAQKPANYGKIIEVWNRIVSLAEVPLPRLQHSTAETYFAKVNVPSANFEKVSGERPNLWLYIHGPAHYEAIRAKREAGVVLPAAEAFTTFDGLVDGNLEDYPKALFDSAWVASIYPDHGWGGKCGEQTDSIFRKKLEYARDSGQTLLDEALRSITDKIDAPAGSVVVFNDLSWKRTAPVSVEIDASTEKRTIVRDDKGRVVPSQILKRDGHCALSFIAEDVPSMGYRTYYLDRGKRNEAEPREIIQFSNFYENEYYRISFGDGGIRSLYDKKLQREVLNTLRFNGADLLNLEYKGNGAGEFTRMTGFTPGDLRTLSEGKSLWEIAEKGPLFTLFKNKQQMKGVDVVQEICVYHTLKRIDVDMYLNFDGTHNRQLRIAFPVNMTKSVINYEVPMAVLEVGRDEMKGAPGGWSWWGKYSQEPREIHPREVQNFISANGSGFGLTLASGVAVADWIDPSIEGSDFPVLQGVLLSSHKSCHGLGNWYHQTGKHHFSFSLLSHEQGWENGYCFGIGVNHPLKAVVKTHEKGVLPANLSFMTVSDPFVSVSILKKADDGKGVILRLTEMKGRDTTVDLTFPFEIKDVIRTNLIEEESGSLGISGKTIRLPLGHHAIETFKLIF